VRVGVLGGTFDPIHLGHLILAETARTQLALDRVAFVPAGDPWRKAARDVTAAEHRVAMAGLAIADNDAFGLDLAEVARSGPSYTVETLQEMKARSPDITALFFIVGADALADMPYWHDPAGIAAQAAIVVAPREGHPLPSTLPFSRDRLIEIAMPYIGISSTEIRLDVSKGRSIRYLVPPAVEAYINEKKLYRSA
jgi:nicotinate-nucleotide adenylyltransferase